MGFNSEGLKGMREIGKSLLKKGIKMDEMKNQGRNLDFEFMNINMEFLKLMKLVKSEMDEMSAFTVALGAECDKL